MRLVQVLAAVGLLGLQLAAPLAAPLAWGVEDSDSTLGTASTVSPSTVAAGGTLSYTLSGFPARAQVEILLDDVETQVLGTVTVGGDGTSSGTVELPKLIGMGPHWLRFRSKPAPLPTASSSSSSAAQTQGASPSLTSGAAQATAAPSPAVKNKSPFFSVGEVTIIGAAPAHRPPAAAGGGETGMPNDSGTAEQHRREFSPLSGAVLATAGVVTALAVGIVLNRRRRLALSFGEQGL
ncbi:Uncharacterised protein [Actinomyces bovis]|uniref:Uncharacterized protein n=1 Tax=Actinomyces bovis TaxID=1658 RepID=A0ABY1VPT5_9ACTO|nr:Uncharacterised protein [Actinomyces bovis]VEG53738.1 Uncharacterised protein [Actinomyces israelii]